MTDLVSRLVWDVDKNSEKKIVKSADNVKKNLKNLTGDELKEMGKNAALAYNELGDLDRGLDALQLGLKAVGASNRDIKKATDAFKEQVVEIRRANDALFDYEQRRRDIKQGGADLSGDIASGASNIRGALDTFTGGNSGVLGGILEIGEAIADLGEFAPLAVAQLSTLGRSINESGGFIGKLSGGFSALIPGLSGSAAGLAAIAVPLAAVAAVGVSVAIVLNQINQAIERRLELEKQTSAVFDAQIAAQSEANQALDELNGERIKSQLETALEEERIASATARDRAQRLYEAQELLNQFTDPFSGQFDLVKAKEQADVVNQLAGEFDNAANQAQTAATVTQVWREAAEKYEAAGGDAAVTTAELVEQTNKLKAEQAQLAAIEQQAADATAQYNKETRRIAEDRRIASVRDEEDFQDSLADIQEKGAQRIADIKKRGQERLADIEGQLSDLPRQLTEGLADAERKAAEERQDILTDYTTDANRAWEDFWRKEAQIQRKAQLDRLRLEEDFRDRLNDAAAEGDVEAFLRAQKEREKALTRQAEDIGEEAQTRAEDFTAESEQRRQDLARRLEDLRNSLAQERAEIRTNFEERRAELLETLEAEKVALKENLTAAYTAIKEQEASLTEDRKKRLQRQQEDERRADADRQRQLQDELRNIGQRRRAILLEIAATNNLTTAANNLRAASAAAASAASRSSSSTRSGTSRAATRTPRNVPIGFATGGLAIATPGGIPARLAENENELVIPVGNAAGTGAAVEALNKLGGMVGGGSRGVGITVQVNDNRTVMVGDIASVSMVEQALAQYDTALTTQIIRGIESARYTPSAA